jgi:rubrerythrin
MNLDEAIQAALDFEGGVHRTYQHAMEKVTDEVGRRVFKVLCDEEMGHIEYLQDRLDEWRKTGRISGKKLRTSIPTKAAIDAGLKSLRRQAAGKPSARGEGELDALHRALAVEIQAGNFYREMVGKLDGAGQQMFARFVEIEEGHLAIVQAEINAVNGLGYWFDIAEFDLEAG